MTYSIIDWLIERIDDMLDLKKETMDHYDENEDPTYEICLLDHQILLGETTCKEGSYHYVAKVLDTGSEVENASKGDIVVFTHNKVTKYNLPFGTYNILNEEDILLVFEES